MVILHYQHSKWKTKWSCDTPTDAAPQFFQKLPLVSCESFPSTPRYCGQRNNCDGSGSQMSKAWFPYNGRFSRRFDTIRAFTWKSGLSSKIDVLCLYQSSRSFMISWPGFRLAFPNAWAFSGTIEVIQNNRRKPDLKKSVFEYKLWYHLLPWEPTLWCIFESDASSLD